MMMMLKYLFLTQTRRLCSRPLSISLTSSNFVSIQTFVGETRISSDGLIIEATFQFDTYATCGWKAWTSHDLKNKRVEMNQRFLFQISERLIDRKRNVMELRFTRYSIKKLNPLTFHCEVQLKREVCYKKNC